MSFPRSVPTGLYRNSLSVRSCEEFSVWVTSTIKPVLIRRNGPRRCQRKPTVYATLAVTIRSPSSPSVYHQLAVPGEDTLCAQIVSAFALVSRSLERSSSESSEGATSPNQRAPWKAKVVTASSSFATLVRPPATHIAIHSWVRKTDAATSSGNSQDDFSMTSLTPYFPAVQTTSHPGCLGDEP